jgi:D-serine deaminase-like pyridoxal phosphate-dependent protein
MDNKSKNKNKKRLLILVALVGVMGIGGVVAATSISINGGVPISLGAGYTTATTCDADVTITAGQTYDPGSNLYKVDAFNIGGLNVASGYCNNKVMQLAVVTSGGTQQASWSLPSSATLFDYQYGASSSVSNAGNYQYASTAMTAFDIATLTTVALSIS